LNRTDIFNSQELNYNFDGNFFHIFDVLYTEPSHDIGHVTHFFAPTNIIITRLYGTSIILTLCTFSKDLKPIDIVFKTSKETLSNTVCKANFIPILQCSARLFPSVSNGTKIYALLLPSGLKWELHFVATVAEHNLNVPVLGF
jgi:hypothetical protein